MQLRIKDDDTEQDEVFYAAHIDLMFPVHSGIGIILTMPDGRTVPIYREGKMLISIDNSSCPALGISGEGHGSYKE